MIGMDADGGMAKYPTNKAGAKYGTGYCDAQCPHDIKFIDGIANSDGWVPSKTDVNSGATFFPPAILGPTDRASELLMARCMAALEPSSSV